MNGLNGTHADLLDLFFFDMQPHQPRYTGKDNGGLLAWVAQVKAHAPTPAPPPVPTLRIPSPTMSSRRTPLASSASPRPFLPLSKPLPAPPIITAPSLFSATHHSKKLVSASEECEADESATLVTPPSSSALDTLSLGLSVASFHNFFDEEEEEEERTSAPSSVLSCDRSPSPRSLSQSSAEKTLSPPPPAALPPRKKGTFTLTPRRSSGSESESESESDSESECSFDDEEEGEGVLSRSSSFGCISASATTPSFHTQQSRQSQSQGQVKGRQHKVYSLEDVLLPSSSVSCSVSPAPASHFSDSEEEEESDAEGEDGEEGERDEDLWQVRGRAPRPVLAC